MATFKERRDTARNAGLEALDNALTYTPEFESALTRIIAIVAANTNDVEYKNTARLAAYHALIEKVGVLLELPA